MRTHLARLLLLTFGLALHAPLVAHEIKVLASHLYLPEGSGKSTVYLSWGHCLPVDELIDADTVVRYDHINPKGKAAPLKKADISLQANVLFLEESGMHQMLVNRKQSIHTYIFDEKGERHFKRGPKTLHKGSKIDSAVRSQQCAKAIVVVGKPGAEPPPALGQALEIVPLDGPAAWSVNATLRFRVLLEGKPLPAADVVARYVGFRPDDAWCYATTTHKNGEFTLRPHHAGAWVLKVASQKPAPFDLRDQFDADKMVATLSLEVRP